MLQRFRKPKWRHPKPSVRRQAVEQLSVQGAEAAGVLRELACEDPDAGVRRSAIRRLADLQLLRQRMLHDPDAGVAEAAAVRYRQILAGGSGDADLQLRIDELAHCPDQRVLAHVLRGGREEALRLAALARCSDESVLADAAVNDPVARVRQTAVERLASEPALRRVMERTRHGDRKVYRLAREKLQALEADAEASRARAEERARVLQALEAAAASQGVVPDAAALARLENRWQAVAEGAEAAASRRFGELLSAARQRHQQAGSAPATQPEPEPALVAEWRAVMGADGLDPDRIETLLERVDAERREQGGSTLPEPLAEHADLVARFMGLREYLAGLRASEGDGPDTDTAETLQSLLAELDWPASLPAPRSVLEARRIIEQRPAEVRQEAESHDPDAGYEAVQAHLKAVEQALGAGNLRAAQRALKQAREAVEAHPGGAGRRTERTLKRYSARVAELRDWRRFATLPKQEALCEQMEALIGADLPPPELAEAIRSLQAAWKETGGSDSAAARRLWERFQTAADRAFEPCRAYFDELERQREANLAERERIVEQLQRFLDQVDVDDLDTAKLMEIRGKAREEWNHFSPVDRRRARALSRRFEALMEQITEHIRNGQAQNRARKAALLERAQALGQIEPLSERLEAAKALQAEWRQLGPATQAQERKLFRAFKAACDAVFEQRDESRRAERDRQASNKAEAERLCERLEALAEDGGEDEAQLSRELDAALAAYQALGPVPGGAREGLQRRFDKAAAGVRRRIARVRALGAERALEGLRERAAVCAELEAGVAAGAADAAAARARWEEMPGDEQPVPEGLRLRWARALQAAEAGDFAEGELAAAQARARRLCVAMEVLAGVDSPAEDADLRMQVQVERLNRGLAEGEAMPGRSEEAVRDLELQWLANGPLPAGREPALERRFHAAREQARGRVSAA